MVVIAMLHLDLDLHLSETVECQVRVEVVSAFEGVLDVMEDDVNAARLHGQHLARCDLERADLADGHGAAVAHGGCLEDAAICEIDRRAGQRDDGVGGVLDGHEDIHRMGGGAHFDGMGMADHDTVRFEDIAIMVRGGRHDECGLYRGRGNCTVEHSDLLFGALRPGGWLKSCPLTGFLARGGRSDPHLPNLSVSGITEIDMPLTVAGAASASHRLP